MIIVEYGFKAIERPLDLSSNYTPLKLILVWRLDLRYIRQLLRVLAILGVENIQIPEQVVKQYFLSAKYFFLVQSIRLTWWGWASCRSWTRSGRRRSSGWWRRGQERSWFLGSVTDHRKTFVGFWWTANKSYFPKDIRGLGNLRIKWSPYEWETQHEHLKEANTEHDKVDSRPDDVGKNYHFQIIFFYT